MKKFYILSIGLALLFMSNKGGRNAGTTGAPGEAGLTCGTCHNGGSFNGDIEIKLANANGDLVSTYSPGEVYDLTVTVSGDDAAGYGFQLVPLTESDDNMAGDWGDLGDDVRLQEDLSRTYIVQSNRKEDGVFTAKWTAPAEGAGSVKFYSTALVANGNNGTTGDEPLQTAVSFEEGGATSTKELDFNINIYPNPTTEILYINAEKEVGFSISNLAGQVVMTQNQSNKSHGVDVSGLNQGTYMISLNNGDVISTKSFVKQ